MNNQSIKYFNNSQKSKILKSFSKTISILNQFLGMTTEMNYVYEDLRNDNQ